MSTTIASAQVRITANTDGIREYIDASVREAVDSVRASIQVDADTALASLKIDNLGRKLDDFGHRDVTATANVKVNDSGLGEAQAGLSGLAAAGLALGPALIPVTAAVSAAAIGLGGSLTSVALGAGVIALASKALKKELSTELSPVLHELQATATAGLLPGFDTLLKDLLPLVPPVNNLVGDLAHTMGGLAAQLGHELDGPGAKNFIGFLDKMAGPTLTQTVHIIEDLAGGFAGLAEASAPLVHELGKGLLGLAGDFEKFGQNAKTDSFQGFLHYLEVEGPPVAHTLEDVGGAVGHVVSALAPLGSISLKGIDTVAKDIDKIPIKDLTLVAEGVAGLAVGLKGLSVATKAGSSLTTLAEGLGLAGPEAILATGAVVGLGVGFYEAYKHSQPFHDAVNDIASTIRTDALPAFHAFEGYVSNTLAPVLEGIGKDALHGVTSALNDVDGALKKNRPQLVQLGHAFEDIGHFLTADVLPYLGPALEDAIKVDGKEISILIGVIADLVKGFDDIAGGAKKAVGEIEHVAGTIENAFDDFKKDAPTVLLKAGEEIVSGLEKGIANKVGPLAHVATGLAHTVDGAFREGAKILSPSKVFEEHGKNIVAGLVVGIDKNGPIAAAAAAALAKRTSAAFSSLDEYIKTTYRSDLAGTPSQIRAGTVGLEYRLATLDRDGYLGSSERKKLDQVTAAAGSRLEELAHATVKVSAAFTSAQSRLSNLRGEAASVRSSALSSFQGLGDPSQFNGITSVGGVLSVLGGEDKVGAAFEANLAKLRKEGLSKSAYDQLFAAGPGQDGQIAALLATASKAQIRQFDKEEGTLTAQGTATGRGSATYLYGRQIREQTRAVDDLRDSLHTLHRDQNHLLTLLVHTLEEATRGEHADLNKINENIRRIGPDLTRGLNTTARLSSQRSRALPRGARI